MLSGIPCTASHCQPQLISDRHQTIGRDGRQLGEVHPAQTLRPLLSPAKPAKHSRRGRSVRCQGSIVVHKNAGCAGSLWVRDLRTGNGQHRSGDISRMRLPADPHGPVIASVLYPDRTCGGAICMRARAWRRAIHYLAQWKCGSCTGPLPQGLTGFPWKRGHISWADLAFGPASDSCHVTAGAQAVSRWSPRRPARAEEERPGRSRAPADTRERRSGSHVRPPSRPGVLSRSSPGTSSPARSAAGAGCNHRSRQRSGPAPAPWSRSAPGRAARTPAWSARIR